MHCLCPVDTETAVDCEGPIVPADAVGMTLTVTPVLPEMLPLLLLMVLGVVLVLAADVDTEVVIDVVVDAALMAKPSRGQEEYEST